MLFALKGLSALKLHLHPAQYGIRNKMQNTNNGIGIIILTRAIPYYFDEKVLQLLEHQWGYHDPPGVTEQLAPVVYNATNMSI